MKLLQRKSVQDISRKQTDERIQEKETLSLEIRALYKELANVRGRKTDQIEKIHGQLRSAEKEYSETISSLSNEVLVLEQRKKVALRPIKKERDELRKEQATLLEDNEKLEEDIKELAFRASQLSKNTKRLDEDRKEVVKFISIAEGKKKKAEIATATALAKISEAGEAILKVDEKSREFQEGHDSKMKELKAQETSSRSLIKIAKATALENVKIEDKIRSDKKTLELAFDEARKKNIL